MINNNLIHNYASSVFDFAKKSNIITEFESDLNKLSQNLSQDLIKELSNPTIAKNTLSEIALDIGGKLNLSKDVVNFLKIVTENRRINLLNNIIDKFRDLHKDDQNIIIAKIYVVNKLSDKYIKNIKLIITKRYPDKIIEIKQIIKKDILGGIIIKIGSKLIDSSIKNSLYQLQLDLQQEYY